MTREIYILHTPFIPYDHPSQDIENTTYCLSYDYID